MRFVPLAPVNLPKSSFSYMRKILFVTLTFWALLYGLPVLAQPVAGKVLSMRERAALRDQWLDQRLTHVLPALMRREGIDMWLIMAREYNEDPVIRTMLPATWLSARRRTILLIYDQGAGKPLETLAIARYDVGKRFAKAWDKETQPEQWQQLATLIEERNPQKIAINRSAHFALADGLSASEHEAFMKHLSPALKERVCSGERLSIGWLETRTPEEMRVYRHICRIAHEIIAEGFSEAVIQVGVTSTEDIVWWYRERIRERKLQAWFHPSVSIQRADPASQEEARSFSQRPEAEVVQPGDLLHVDFGITYLGLNTDTQQHAYVLKEGETAPPEDLVEALAIGNRLQDILTGTFKTGRTGNEMLSMARKQALAEGITPSIYTHPIGYHGHGAGPTIGLWDQQEGVPIRGDYPLFPNTAYSIELNASVPIDSWGKTIRIMLEEDAYFDGNSVHYIDGRQTRLLLIPRGLSHVGHR